MVCFAHLADVNIMVVSQQLCLVFYEHLCMFECLCVCVHVSMYVQHSEHELHSQRLEGAQKVITAPF